MRREERVTVQGPVKEQQPDGMSHRGALCARCAILRSPQKIYEQLDIQLSTLFPVVIVFRCTVHNDLDIQMPNAKCQNTCGKDLFRSSATCPSTAHVFWLNSTGDDQ